MLFADLVRKERKKLGLLSQELANKSGLGQGYISAVENGRKNPNIKNAVKIAKALKLDVGIFTKVTDPKEAEYGARTIKARRAAARARGCK